MLILQRYASMWEQVSLRGVYECVYVYLRVVCVRMSQWKEVFAILNTVWNAFFMIIRSHVCCNPPSIILCLQVSAAPPESGETKLFSISYINDSVFQNHTSYLTASILFFSDPVIKVWIIFRQLKHVCKARERLPSWLIYTKIHSYTVLCAVTNVIWVDLSGCN